MCGGGCSQFKTSTADVLQSEINTINCKLSAALTAIRSICDAGVFQGDNNVAAIDGTGDFGIYTVEPWLATGQCIKDVLISDLDDCA